MPQGLQAPGHPGFTSPTTPYDCAACIRWHGDRFGFSDLDPANYEAWGLYQKLHGQVRIGMDVVGLDWGAIPIAFDLYQVEAEERLPLFEKLLVVDQEAADHRSRESERRKRSQEAQAAMQQHRRTLG